MRSLRPVDLAFFDEAPVRVRAETVVAAPPEAVFAEIAGDPARWAGWMPGFSRRGHWETPPPHGVGSRRTVQAFGAWYRETILAWDDSRRWAFRVDATTVPMFRAFAEDYRVTPSNGQTLLTWTVAFEPTVVARALTPFAPRLFTSVLRRAGSRLGDVAGPAATRPLRP